MGEGRSWGDGGGAQPAGNGGTGQLRVAEPGAKAVLTQEAMARGSGLAVGWGLLAGTVVSQGPCGPLGQVAHPKSSPGVGLVPLGRGVVICSPWWWILCQYPRALVER